MADAIVDITSTGTTLKMNRLAVVDEVLSSSVRLFGRTDVVDDPKVRRSGRRSRRSNRPRASAT